MRVSDGFENLMGGMASGLKPSLIQANQAALLVNVSVRGGTTTHRPILRPVKLDNQVVIVGGGDLVQGMEAYNPTDGSTPYFFAQVGGKLYRIDLDGTKTDVTVAGDPNSPTLPMVWFKQGEQYMFLQDGQARPLIYDGATWRRALKSEPPYWEMPTGTAMEYAFGRMFVARGRNWVAGDIRGGPTEIYQFTENTFLAEGGSWNVPIPGLITAIKVMTTLDNAIGQGPLTIHTPNGIVTARVDQPRNTWKDIIFQQVANQRQGGLSQNSCVLVNGDLWFRATDGWRSLILARRDFSGWGNVPQSFEMARILAYDDPKMLKYASAVLYDNYLIGTSWPKPIMAGGYHKGMVGLDFAALGSLAKANQVPPAWDGAWTGIYPEAITRVAVKNKERVFILARNTNTDLNELWELVSAGDFDSIDGRIEWKVETAAVTMGPAAGTAPSLQVKKLMGAHLYLEDIKGPVDVSVEFRSDQYPCWLPWCEFQVCTPYRDCTTWAANCSIPQPMRPGFKVVKFPQPPATCQQGSDVPARVGRQFQARMTFTGHCVVNKFIMFAETQEDAPYTPNTACAG